MSADKAEPRPVMLVNVRVSDLGVTCTYPTRTYVIAAPDTCQRPADTVVVERTGVRMYRCPKHRGMATPGVGGGVDVSEYVARRLASAVHPSLWVGEPYPLALPSRKAPGAADTPSGVLDDDAPPRVGDRVRYAGTERTWEARRDRDYIVIDRYAVTGAPHLLCEVQEVRADQGSGLLDRYLVGSDHLRVVARATYTEVADGG